jgi:hypothetical protein
MMMPYLTRHLRKIFAYPCHPRKIFDFIGDLVGVGKNDEIPDKSYGFSGMTRFGDDKVLGMANWGSI